MGHACGHHHHHHAPPERMDVVFATGIALNTVYVGIELWAGHAAHSLALTADAWHNLGDVFSLALAWGAAALARRPPSPARTYGLGRTTIYAALLNAALLLMAAGAIAWGAALRLLHPEPVATGLVAIAAAGGVVVNGITALMLRRGGGHTRDLNQRGAFLHMAFDAALSLGVVISALVVGATQWFWLDPAVSLVIVAAIAGASARTLKQSAGLSLDAVPAGIDRAEVMTALKGLPGVTAVHDLHIWPLSTTSTALTAHIVRPEPQDDAWLFAAADTLRTRFGIDHATIQVERGDAGNACRLEPDDVV
jgi:cobalt-zinc-cadmium efflux system protein